MPLITEYYQRIRDWADHVSTLSDFTYVNETDLLHSAKRKYDMNASRDDYDTPRPTKVARLASDTPTRSGGDFDLDDTAVSRSASTTSTATTDSRRSGSPKKNSKKRARLVATLYSRPVLQDVEGHELEQWRKDNPGLMASPGLTELFDCFSDKQDQKNEGVDEDRLEEIFQDFCAIPNGANEDYWSDYVVFPCLRLAKKWSRRTVSILPVKTVGVSDPTLLPATQRSTKQRVDYSIAADVLPPDQKMVLKRDVMPLVDGNSLGQSNHPQVREKILFSHVEIKTTGDTVEAESQLKTWCCAGFAKQKRMSRSEKPLLAPQPLWIWTQDTITLMVAVLDTEQEMLYFLKEDKFMIRQKEKDSLRRFVRLLARVFEWGDTTYAEWFRCDLLGREELSVIPS